MNKDTFEGLVGKNQFRTLRQMLTEMEAVEVARLLENVPHEKAVMAFRLLPKRNHDRNMLLWYTEAGCLFVWRMC